MVLGGPQHVVAVLVHHLSHVARGEERLAQLLVGIAPVVGWCAVEPDVVELDLADVEDVEALDHADYAKTLDDAQVALGGAVEHAQRLLISRPVVGLGGGLDAVEFDDDDALGEARFVGLGSVAAGEEASAGGLDRGAGEFGVGGELVGVVDRAIGRDPVGFGHGVLRYAG